MAAEPSAESVSGFAETWPTLDPETRRDVARALVSRVLVNKDKTVTIVPRWSEPVVVTFRKRKPYPTP